MTNEAGRLCLGTQQYAILSALSLGSGECPICRQQVQVSADGIAYAHLAEPAMSESRARELLGAAGIRERPDGSLKDSGGYLVWKPSDLKAEIVSGIFSPDELKAIAFWMERNV